MVRGLSLVCGTLVVFAVPAQEQFGLFNSNYAGTDAVSLNPARMVTQWQWRDINIIGFDLSAWNDHVYVTGRERSVLGTMQESIATSSADGFVINESLDPGARHAFVNARVLAPAISFSMGKSAIGAHISSRAALSFTGAGSEIGRFGYNGLGYTPQHGLAYDEGGMRLVGAAWSEIGLSYARLLVADGFGLLSAGVTGRYLVPHAGGGLVFEKLSFSVMDTANAEISDAAGHYGYAAPAAVNGSGFGFDVGFVYERTMDEVRNFIPHQSQGGCKMPQYRYRIGASLVDIGGMSFTDPIAGSFSASSAMFNNYEGIHANGVEGIDSLLSNSLSGFVRTQELSVGLPTAFAFQYDQRIMDHVYLSADLVQNLAFWNSLRLRRANTTALVARYETRRWEAAVPLVFREYDLAKPSVGLMLRSNNVVLGSDDLLPLVLRGSVYGVDAYVRVKWTIFRSPICRGKKKAAHRQGDTNALPCTVIAN
jgi:hypothetical protein